MDIATPRFDEAKALATQFGFTLELRESGSRKFLVLAGHGQTFHSHSFLSQKIAMVSATAWVQGKLLQGK
jgi:hypothetical protein